ncbi:MAG: hypothetical protein ABSB74_21515 [Tepidisphaeraceae bacterium]
MELRPIWQQHEHRVKGHNLVSFIAYAMWKTLPGWKNASGLGERHRQEPQPRLLLVGKG